MWTMCEFHDSNCNGFGDKWWTDKCTYFSSILLHLCNAHKHTLTVAFSCTNTQKLTRILLRPLFAFYCPLFFYDKKKKIMWHFATDAMFTLRD